MISEASAAQWLADQVGADWLHVGSRPNDTVGTDFVVTLRFEKYYCQSLVSLRADAACNVKLFDALVKRISQMRDEFFLLNMHAIPLEEGTELEAQSRK